MRERGNFIAWFLAPLRIAGEKRPRRGRPRSDTGDDHHLTSSILQLLQLPALSPSSEAKLASVVIWLMMMMTRLLLRWRRCLISEAWRPSSCCCLLRLSSIASSASFSPCSPFLSVRCVTTSETANEDNQIWPAQCSDSVFSSVQRKTARDVIIILFPLLSSRSASWTLNKHSR